jgi:biopolymer transport protein ExbB/TolQ
LFLKQPPHLGTFLAAFWLQTLAALLLSGLLIAVVAYTRRQIDTALERRSQLPALRDAVITVGDEAERAKQLRQTEREAVKQVEKTVLREASGQETDEEETESAAMGEEKANEKGREGMV